MSHAGRGPARAAWAVAIVLVLAAPFLLTPWVHGDGIGYVAYLRSAVVDHDLDLSDEFAYLSTHMRADAGGLPGRLLAHSAHAPGVDPTFQAPQPDPVTGRVPSNYSIGPALLWAPAYALVQAASGSPAGPHAGYGGAGYLAIALTTFAFGLAGVLLARRYADAVAPPATAAAAALGLVFATSLLYYLYLGPSYAHAFEVFTASAFVLHAERTRGDARTRTWAARGALVGLLFIVHWNDVVLALPVLGLETVRLARARGVRGLLACALAGLAGFALVAWPQFAIWQHFHGRPWVRHPVDYVRFSPAGLLGTLVSARHGLFTWTPITLVAVAGLVGLVRRERERALLALAALALLLLSNCAVRDWWGGSAFGARRMLAGAPYLVLGLAAALAALQSAVARVARNAAAGTAAVALVVAAFAAWNGGLLAQYALGMIDHDAPVPLATLAANQPRVLVRLVRLAREVAR